MHPGWNILALSVGGALGVNARYWIGVWFSKWVSPDFPWATFAINVSGSFAIGFLATVIPLWFTHPGFRLFWIVGFLGGFTTFSSLALESLVLWERGNPWMSAANALGSLATGMFAVVLGVALGRLLIR